MGLLIGLFLADAFAFEYVAGRSSRARPRVQGDGALGRAGGFSLALAVAPGGFWPHRRDQSPARPVARPGRRRDLGGDQRLFCRPGRVGARSVRPETAGSADGAGLNPILQSYWMTSHPVMLYLGYVGFSVPFAYALSSLVTGEAGAGSGRSGRWRRWWPGPFSAGHPGDGARWAYEVLGWQGYGWGPSSRNASFMPGSSRRPSSSGTTRKRGMLARAEPCGGLGRTYLLTRLRDLHITCSGILSSVHPPVSSRTSARGSSVTWAFFSLFSSTP